MLDRNNARNGLISTLETIKICTKNDCSNCLECVYEKMADAVIAAGWQKPPCNVGDTIYVVGELTQQITPLEVSAIQYDKNDIYLFSSGGIYVSVNRQLGKVVFLTLKAAQNKIKKRGAGNG